MFYIYSQIIEIIALIITLVAYHRKLKNKIFKQMMVANVFDMIHYLLLGAYSGLITKIIAFVRNYVIIAKEKKKFFNSKLILYLFVLIYIISALFTYKNIFSILPIVAAIIYLVVVWNGNELKVKKIAFYCYFLWLIYNISIFSIFAIISNIISLISTGIAVLNEKNDTVTL